MSRFIEFFHRHPAQADTLRPEKPQIRELSTEAESILGATRASYADLKSVFSINYLSDTFGIRPKAGDIFENSILWGLAGNFMRQNPAYGNSYATEEINIYFMNEHNKRIRDAGLGNLRPREKADLNHIIEKMRVLLVGTFTYVKTSEDPIERENRIKKAKQVAQNIAIRYNYLEERINERLPRSKKLIKKTN